MAMAIGISIHTDSTVSGYILKIAAITSPKIASTIIKAKNRMSRNNTFARGPIIRPATSPMV